MLPCFLLWAFERVAFFLGGSFFDLDPRRKITHLSLFPQNQGTITGVKTRRSDGARMASVWLTDRRLRLTLPLEEALSYLLKMAPAKAEEEEEAEAAERSAVPEPAAAPPPLPMSPLSSVPAAPPPPPETPMRVAAAVKEQQPEENEGAAATAPPPSSPPSPPPLSPPTPVPPVPPISPPPPSSPAAGRSGPGLLARLAAASAPPRVPSSEHSPGRWAAFAPPGTRVWVLLRGKLGLKDVAVGGGGSGGASGAAARVPVAWPAVLFSMSRVPKADVPLLLQTFGSSPRAGGNGGSRALVLFYGERSLMWSRLADLEPWLGESENGGESGESSGVVASRLSVLRASSSGPKVGRKIALAAAEAIREAAVTVSDPERELERSARARAAGALAAATGGAARAAAAEARVPAAAASTAEGDGAAEQVAEAEAESAAATPTPEVATNDPNVYCSLPACHETISLAEERDGSCVRCDRCGERAHTLCLSPPALKRSDLTEKHYDCPGCGVSFSPGLDSSSSSRATVGGKGASSAAVVNNSVKHGGKSRFNRLRCSGRNPPTQQQEERMGLTPDRIIEGAIRVFGLEPPTQVSSSPFFFSSGVERFERELRKEKTHLFFLSPMLPNLAGGPLCSRPLRPVDELDGMPERPGGKGKNVSLFFRGFFNELARRIRRRKKKEAHFLISTFSLHFSPSLSKQERLYDKHANGLLLSNSWAGYHVLLNPEFSANIAHR